MVGSVTLPLPPSMNHAYSTNPYTHQRVPKKVLKDYWNVVRYTVAQAVAEPFDHIEHITYEFCWPTNHRRDTENYLKSLKDGLKGCLFTDDRWQVIPKEDIRSRIDKENPGVIVRWGQTGNKEGQVRQDDIG